MLKYIIIQLDDTCPSFCYYPNVKKEKNLMPYDLLQQGIFFAMKENLSIQILYPSYEIPKKYQIEINKIDHVEIKTEKDNQIECIEKKQNLDIHKYYIYRIAKGKYPTKEDMTQALEKYDKVNVLLLDIDKYKTSDYYTYEQNLKEWSSIIEHQIECDKNTNLNVITDRILLKKMNNCNAGVDHITLAPDGNFYICPAFYQDNDTNIGNINTGIFIKNAQMLNIQHAPICKHCDCWHCKRCVWLNQKDTNEINTPSHEQCLNSHIERSYSQKLLVNCKSVFQESVIPEIDYMDPFEKLEGFRTQEIKKRQEELNGNEN